MSSPDAPIPTPRAQKLAAFKQRRLPSVVWLACAVICVWMLVGRARRFEYVGLAQAAQHEISSPTTGRLEALFVDLYEPVSIGDVLAKLDDSELAAQLETSQASIRVLQAQLLAARAELQSTNQQGVAGMSNDLRRFQADEEERWLMALELRARIESDEIELERLNLQVGRADQVLADGLIPQLQHDDIRLQRDQMREQVEQTRGLLVQTEQEYRTARVRREHFEVNLPRLPPEEPVLAPLREAIGVESQRLREIETQRAHLVLRSPVEGEVTQILCRVGQAVVPGEPILTVTDGTVQEIVAYLDEFDRRRVQLNTPVLLSSLDQPGRSTESYVIRVGSGIDPLPPRLWLDPAVPDYGRAVVIAPLQETILVPGERLSVRFRSP